MVCKCCGNTTISKFTLIPKGSQVGCYCDNCGKWQKWVGKDEQRALIGMGVKVQGDLGKRQCTCGCCVFITKQGDIHTGLYCEQCGKWFTWLKKGKG